MKLDSEEVLTTNVIPITFFVGGNKGSVTIANDYHLSPTPLAGFSSKLGFRINYRD